MQQILRSIVDYSQPDFYHFSEDSIFLKNEAIKIINQIQGKSVLKIMDLCCGCGVVGLEILQSAKREIFVDFFEIQKEFQQYFYKNANGFLNLHSNFQYITKSFEELINNQYANLYDFIVCNPPYFYPDSSRLSPNHQRNVCRFFIQGKLEDLLKSIGNCLKIGSKALILRPQSEALNIKKLQAKLGLNVSINIRKKHNKCLLLEMVLLS